MKILNGISTVSLQSTRYLVDSLKKISVYSDIVVYRSNPLLRGYEDINLNINKNNILFYPYYFLKVFGFFVFSLFKYKIFHFHFGHTLLPYNLDLPILKFFNKKILMEYHGSDIRIKSNFLDTPLEKFCLPEKFNFSRQKRILKYVNGIIVHDKELKNNLISGNKAVYVLPLRIDLRKFSYSPNINTNKSEIYIVHSPSKEEVKGTSYVLKAIEELKKKYSIKFELIKNLSNADLKEYLRKADIIIDQLVIGQYGMLSIEGMALGKPVICYLNPDYFDSPQMIPPIWNADINNIKDKLEDLIKDVDLRNKLGLDGRQFVENHHNSDEIAKQLKNIYIKI